MRRTRLFLVTVVLAGASVACQGRGSSVQVDASAASPASPTAPPAPSPGGGGGTDSDNPRTGVIYWLPVDGNPAQGEVLPKVTMVIATGYTRGGAALRRLLPDLLQKHARDLRVVYKAFAIQGEPTQDVNLLLCAAHRQGKYFEAADAAWPILEQVLLKMDAPHDSMRIAGGLSALVQLKAGLEPGQMASDITGVCPNLVNHDYAELYGVGVLQAPAVFLNGKYIQEPYTADTLETAIAAEAEFVSRRIASGVALATYYKTQVLDVGLKAR